MKGTRGSDWPGRKGASNTHIKHNLPISRFLLAGRQPRPKRRPLPRPADRISRWPGNLRTRLTSLTTTPTGDEMRHCGPDDGNVLDNGGPANGHHLPPAVGPLPIVKHPQQFGDLQLLHERHDNSLHRRVRPRHLHRAQPTPLAHRPRGHEVRRLQPQETPRGSPLRLHVTWYVDIQHRLHCSHGAYHLCCAARAGEGLSSLFFTFTIINSPRSSALASSYASSVIRLTIIILS
jgi:hypothetical protein